MSTTRVRSVLAISIITLAALPMLGSTRYNDASPSSHSASPHFAADLVLLPTSAGPFTSSAKGGSVVASGPCHNCFTDFDDPPPLYEEYCEVFGFEPECGSCTFGSHCYEADECDDLIGDYMEESHWCGVACGYDLGWILELCGGDLYLDGTSHDPINSSLEIPDLATEAIEGATSIPTAEATDYGVRYRSPCDGAVVGRLYIGTSLTIATETLALVRF